MKKLITGLLLMYSLLSFAQDTFSIVAADPVTGEVGSAGASCLDLYVNNTDWDPDFITDVLPGKAAINTQAYVNLTSKNNASQRMLAGNSSSQIINWLINHDAQGTSEIRQYGIAALINGAASVKAYRGKLS